MRTMFWSLAGTTNNFLIQLKMGEKKKSSEKENFAVHYLYFHFSSYLIALKFQK